MINLRLSNHAVATRCWQDFVGTFAKEVELEYSGWRHIKRNNVRMQRLTRLPQLASHVNFLTLRTRVGHWLAIEGFRGYSGLLTNLRSLCLSSFTIKGFQGGHTRCLKDLTMAAIPQLEEFKLQNCENLQACCMGGMILSHRKMLKPVQRLEIVVDHWDQ